jgi:hypothetical protein
MKFTFKQINKHQRKLWDKHGNVVEMGPIWNSWEESEPEIHNALIRTARSAITYDEPKLIESVKKHFRKFTMINYPKKYWYQACRAIPREYEDDVSRDQVCMALVALYLKDRNYAKEIAEHLPFKLSRRFKMTITYWLWVKYIHTGKHKLFENLFLLEIFLTYALSLFGMKFKIKSLIYPGYALQLSAWQLFIMPDTKIKKWTQDLLLKLQNKLDDKNYLNKMLLGEKIDIDTLDYKPMNAWRWSKYISDKFWGTKSTMRNLEKDELGNNADYDILFNFDKIKNML